MEVESCPLKGREACDFQSREVHWYVYCIECGGEPEMCGVALSSDADWKRVIGIAISCYDDDNDALPFPIKIASSEVCQTYNNLHPANGTQ